MFDGETVMEKLVAHRERGVPSLLATRRNIPVEVDAIFQQMVVKEPGRRYESMSELASDIERFLAGDRPRAMDRIHSGRVRRGRWRLVWSVLSAAALVGLVAWLGPQRASVPSRNGSPVDSSAEDDVTATVSAVPIEEAEVDLRFARGKPSEPSSSSPSKLESDNETAMHVYESASPTDTRPAGTLSASSDRLRQTGTPGTVLPIGHPNTLANGGRGRAMVIVSPRGFNATEYKSVCNALTGREIEVVTASSTSGSASPNDKQLDSVQIGMTLDDFNVSDFDAVIFCGGNVVEFKSQQTLQKVRRIADACLSQMRVVAAVGNASVVLKESGYLEGDLRDDRGLLIENFKDHRGRIIIAPSLKQVDTLIELTFVEILGKANDQPRMIASPRADPERDAGNRPENP